MFTAAALGQPACYDRGGDLEIALCWKDEDEAVDKQLSAFWPDVLDAARDSDRRFSATQHKGKASAESDLQTAQKNWLKWRESECFARADWAQGGSQENIEFGQCYFDLTQQRLIDLKNLLGFFRDH
nr:lysozyme inhibitor LprI family protein [Sphingobium subterraneum]